MKLVNTFVIEIKFLLIVKGGIIMPARYENEMEITKKIEVILQDMPRYVRDWHNNLYASKRTASSRRDYVRKIRKMLEFIDKDVMNVTSDKITDEVITSYFISIGTKANPDGTISETSDSYQQGVYCALKNFLGFMVRKGYIEKNYILEIEKPSNKDLDRINEHRLRFSKKDFESVINVAKQEKDDICRKRDVALLKVFMGTGMRATALKILNVTDVDIQKGTLVTVDKGSGKGKLQQYYLNKSTVEALQDWVECRKRCCSDDEALFLSHQGKRLSYEGISKVVEKYFDKALGLHVTPHKIRGGVASILYTETKDIEFVRRSIGHTNSSTTQRYISTDNNERQQAAELLEF